MSFLDTESIKEEAIQERNDAIAPQNFVTAEEYLIVRYSQNDMTKYVILFTNDFTAGITIKDIEQNIKGIGKILRVEMISQFENISITFF